MVRHPSVGQQGAVKTAKIVSEGMTRHDRNSWEFHKRERMEEDGGRRMEGGGEDLRQKNDGGGTQTTQKRLLKELHLWRSVILLVRQCLWPPGQYVKVQRIVVPSTHHNLMALQWHHLTSSFALDGQESQLQWPLEGFDDQYCHFSWEDTQVKHKFGPPKKKKPLHQLLLQRKYV